MTVSFVFSNAFGLTMLSLSITACKKNKELDEKHLHPTCFLHLKYKKHIASYSNICSPTPLIVGMNMPARSHMG